MESGESQHGVPYEWPESAHWPVQPENADSDKYFKKYCRVVGGSEGFVAFWDRTSALVGEVRPYYVTEKAKKAADFAIEEHNTWGADLVLVRILKVNVQTFTYYMTLEATSTSVGEPAYYETEVFRDREIPKGFKLVIFRRAIFYNDGPYQGLKSFRQFIEELEDDVLPDECAKRYKEYRSEYISTQKRAFFNTHKDEKWFKDRYFPTNLRAVVERRNEHARQVAKDFLIDLHRGTLDLTSCVTPSSTSKSRTMLKAHPISCQPRRIVADIEQVHSLILKLDGEKGIEGLISKFYRNENSNRIEFVLDTLISYLWCVHGVNYYGMIEKNQPKGCRHVRPDGEHSEADSEAEDAGAEWEKKLDLFWQKRLRSSDPLKAMASKESIYAAADLGPFMNKMRDDEYEWKFGYGGGDEIRRFHAAKFVSAHLKDKPLEYVMEVTSKALEDLYFRNFMSDPDALSGTPVVQQP